MKHKVSILAAMAFVVMAGCATAPKTAKEKSALITEANSTLNAMMIRDPGIRNVVDRSAGYVVFPKIAKGGLLVGGAYGRGVVYHHGRAVGYAELNQGSLGAQIGGQTFSELIVFQDPNKLAKLENGKFDIGANASGVVVTAGAAASANFDQGMAVFLMPSGGLMAELSLAGQQINFQPIG